jgi:hypothetical protein
MLIYQIVHIESGHKYVGQTTRPETIRFREHLYCLRAGKHKNRYLQAAWTKYGESAFRFEVIKTVNTIEELDKEEQNIIENSLNLYNLTEGGKGHTHDKDTKRIIGEANKKPIVGMCIKTGEIKEYESAMDTKMDGFNEKCVRKCVLKFTSFNKNRPSHTSASTGGWVWISKEEFSLEKLQERCVHAKRGKVRNERPILGKSLKTGEIVRFKSAKEASYSGFNSTIIGRATQFKTSKTSNDFVWVFADVDNCKLLLEERYVLIYEIQNKPKQPQKPLLIPVIGMNILTKEIKKYTCVNDVKKDGFTVGCVSRVINSASTKKPNGVIYKNLSHKNWIWSKKTDISTEEFTEISETVSSNKYRKIK